MNADPEPPDDRNERRAQAIERLLERAAASIDPIGWVRDFTLRALREPSLDALPAADRAEARRQIHAISREVNRRLRSLDSLVAVPPRDA